MQCTDMKISYLLCAILALTAAAPKPKKLQFRNLFKPAVADIKTVPTGRIVGGQEAEPHSIPYQAFLEIYSENEGWYCGGTLISENYILTAAHCCNDAVEVHITLGAHKPHQADESHVSIVSSDFIKHEEYDEKENINDIGVIKLPESINLTAEIQLVTLPSRKEAQNSYEGLTGRISGWGLTDGFGNDVSEVLNYVNVEIISNSECEESFGSLLPSIICVSGKENTGACSGDSGGPLVVDDVQIGVVSFGIFFCLDGFPSAFSRVTSYLDWIGNNTDVQIK